MSTTYQIYENILSGKLQILRQNLLSNHIYIYLIKCRGITSISRVILTTRTSISMYYSTCYSALEWSQTSNIYNLNNINKCSGKLQSKRTKFRWLIISLLCPLHTLAWRISKATFIFSTYTSGELYSFYINRIIFKFYTWSKARTHFDSIYTSCFHQSILLLFSSHCQNQFPISMYKNMT